MVVGIFALGTIATITAITSYSLTKSFISGSGIFGSVHYLGSGVLERPSLLSSVGEAITSPFTAIIQFLLEYLITPLILIGFLILFFASQYYLIKAYFVLGKHISTGVLKIIDKMHLTEKSKEMTQHLSKMFFHN